MPPAAAKQKVVKQKARARRIIPQIAHQHQLAYQHQAERRMVNVPNLVALAGAYRVSRIARRFPERHVRARMEKILGHANELCELSRRHTIAVQDIEHAISALKRSA